MYTILNKTERLIHAPNGEMLPPGVTVTVSEDTMNHPQMQELSNQGALEVKEVEDPPAGTVTGAAAGGGPVDPVTGVQKVNPEAETKATPTPTPAPTTTTVNTKQSSK